MFIGYRAGKRIGAALLLCASMADAQVTARWTNTSGGLWHVASNWSTNPVPAGTNYDVVFDLPSASTYSAEIGSGVSPAGIQLNSIRLDSSTARIEQLSRSVSVGSLLLNSGTYLLDSGTFSGRIAGSGGLFIVTGSAAFDGVVIDRPIRVGGSVQIHNGLTLNNTRVFNSGFGGVLNFRNQSFLAGSGTIDSVLSVNATTFSIPPTFTMHRGASLNSTGATLINNGVFALNAGSIESLGQGSVTTSRFYNDGTIEISNRSRAELYFGFQNRAGVIRVQNGTLMFGQSGIVENEWKLEHVGQLDLQPGSTVHVAGRWDNTSSVISPAVFGDSVILSGFYRGGVIDAGTVGWQANRAVATDVTWRGTVDIASTQNGADLTIVSVGTLDGATFRIDANSSFRLLDGARLTGQGTINIDAPTLNSIQSINGGTIDAGVYIRGSAFDTRISGSPTHSLVLRGTTHAEGGKIVFDSVRNEGTILASAVGRAQVNSSIQQVGTLEAAAGGTIELHQMSTGIGALGSLRNSGGVFHFSESTFLVAGTAVDLANTFATLAFSNSRVVGDGSIFGNGAVLATGTLLVEQAQIAPSLLSFLDRARVNFNDAATLKSPTVRLGGAELYFNSIQGQELATAGRIEYLTNVGQSGAPELDNRIDATQGTLTIGSLTTVATVSGAGSLFGTPLINFGTISSAVAGHGILASSRGLMVNHGTLEALNGGRLAIGGATGGFSNNTSFTNAGLIRIAGGSTLTFSGTMTTAGIGVVHRELATGGGRVNLSGFINNSGATLNTATAFGEGSVVMIAGSNISGGTVNTIGGPALYADTAILTSTALIGELQLIEARPLFIGSSLAMNGAVIGVPTASSVQSLSGTGTISGVGTIVLQGPGDSARLGSTFGSLVLGPGIEVLAENSGGSALNVRLRGTLTASAASKTFTMFGRTTNDGTINVRDGMRVTGSDTFNNSASGLIRVEQHSMFRYGGGTFSNSGAIDLAGGAMVLEYPAAGPSVATSIRNQLAAGFAGGSWSGSGIRSTIASADPEKRLAVGWSEAFEMFGSFPAQFFGESVDASAILLRNTLYGDADLDGTVDISDFGRLAASFNLAAGQRWSSGDFNYDGAVHLDDFAALARNYNLTAPEFKRRAVPEPSGFLAGCIAVRLLISRRRKIATVE